MRFIVFALPVLLALVASAAACADTSSMLGAWQRSDGRLFTLVPSAEGAWRYRMLDDGRSGRLHALGDGRWQAGQGFSDREPAGVLIELQGAQRLSWQEADGQLWQATRLPLREQDFSVDAQGTQLAARLVLPAGEGPHPLVVLLHGSEGLPAVGAWQDPYMLAAHGIAGVVFDKRGTGRSQGEFSADFQRLAEDAVAVARAAEAMPGVASDRTGFAGYSQGGWVAPLAADKHGKARAVLVAYGAIDSPLHEDRWQCRSVLRENIGEDAAAMTVLDTWVTATHAVLDSGLEQGWGNYRSALRQARAQPWFTAIDGARCIAAGFAPYPAWVLRTFASRRLPPQIDWDYDSHALLARLDLPMLWQLGGDDLEVPTDATAAAVRALQQTGKPYRLHVYPGADHGMLTWRNEGGQRVPTGYHPDYYRHMVQFWREQFGLSGPPSS